MNETFEISVNNEPVTVVAGATIVDLLAQLKIKSRALAVEINREILPQDEFSKYTISPGDVLEVVTLVGGG